nr:MAG TPA: hypothetical protein [Caudoviricetes sp.]
MLLLMYALVVLIVRMKIMSIRLMRNTHRLGTLEVIIQI